MEIGVKTSRGRIREINQDFYYISDGLDYPLFIIADGMGGHKAGEVASKMAVEIISSTLERDISKLKLKDDYIVKSIKDSIWRANEEIYKKAQESQECHGMGTTVTLAWDIRDKIYIGHVGDSRAYILRNKELVQITEDHSLVEELIKNGSISREEARYHPQKNVITRAVGTSEDIRVDIIVKEKLEGDILLLCTDGLTNMLNDEEIKELLLVNEDIQKACDYLVQRSNDKGGFDNISVVAIKYK